MADPLNMSVTTTDVQLAEEIILRLNQLIQHEDIRRDLRNLIETRIDCSFATREDRRIQTVEGKVGFLGMLNGLVGTIPPGHPRYAGWGYIAARFDDNGRLECFFRQDLREPTESNR